MTARKALVMVGLASGIGISIISLYELMRGER